MASEFKTNVMPLNGAVSHLRPEPVQAVERARNEQPLPDSGKTLPPEETEKVTQEKISEAVSNLNDYVQAIRRELKFSIDEDSGRTVITVVDSETKEVIRQIPPEEVLSLSQHLGDKGGAILIAET